MAYPFKKVEAEAQRVWTEKDVYRVIEDQNKPKFYVLDMFPYPSGAGLHVGHPLGYIASDIYSRYKRLKGFNVLHPMGFDAFGLPAEQYAIQTGRHPADTTKENIARYKEQMAKIGFSYDWSREVRTCDPNYYKWTQWIFIQLFNSWYNNDIDKAESIDTLVDHFEKNGSKGLNAACADEMYFSSEEWKNSNEEEKSEILMNYRLAYRKVGYVNWCEELGTVLANDQVKDGLSERGGYPVVQRAMTQWYLRITAYAERLLKDLDSIDWSDALKAMQSNWIGRSEGASIFFPVAGSDHTIEVFTTRPDTIFGATFMVLAPKHELVEQLTTPEQRAEIEKYVAYVSAKSEVERMAEKKVTGAFTGAYAINPFNDEKIPIWISEYVLKDYGTGAIMSVPSDDDRDKAFAEKFNLLIIDVIDKSKYPGATLSDKVGVVINSGFMNGMEVPEAIKAACAKAEELQIGKTRINYKLRDANFGRQRYWGEPFPISYKDGVAYALSEEELPLELPETEDFLPGEDGKSPLSQLDWATMPDGNRRETDVMPAVAGSSWYYLRYMDPANSEAFAGKEAIDYWQDVDLYIGGTEHAVAHLMYARFWHKFLFDMNLVPTQEPFKRLVNQGMIQGVSLFFDSGERSIHVPIEYADEHGIISKGAFEKLITADNRFEGIDLNSIDWDNDGIQLRPEVEKMSKSKYNVINPDDIIGQYGADVFRMFEMFLGPIEQHKPWDTKGIEGVAKFMRRFWSLYFNENNELILTDEEPTSEELKILHKTIKKVAEDIERLSFNTSVSAFMIAANELTQLKCHKKAVLKPLAIVLSSFAPHTSEYIWQEMGQSDSIVNATFPEFDEQHLAEDNFEYPVSVNGKMRTKISLPVDASEDDAKQAVLADEKIQKWLDGKEMRKFIFVKGRIINVVV